jgi:CDP-6-deoxy-D-xylo-4-hexulose-3-dehydrase
MKIGITGSSGCLGSLLFRKLNSVASNVISNFEGDVTSYEDVLSWVQSNDFDIIFHLAAIVPINIVKKNTNRAYEVNVVGTKNVIKSIHENDKAINFIFTSTSHVYETSSMPLKESSNISPLNEYAKTKIDAEEILSKYMSLDSFNGRICIARLFSVYHESQDDHFLFKSIANKIKDRPEGPIDLYGANNIRDFLYAEDVIDILVKLSKLGVNDIVNIGSGYGLSIEEFAKINFCIPKLNCFYDEEPTQLIADTSRLKRYLNNEPVELKIKLATETIDKNELSLLAEWIQAGNRLTKGDLTVDFEKAFSSYIGSKYSIFVNSGSSANLLSAYSILHSGYLKNNKVIVPSVSWITTVSPFIQFKYEVLMCDCDLNNLGLDLNHLEALCKKHNPGLVVLCNVLGHANSFEEIQYLANKYDFLIIEDNCEGLGSEYNNKKLGSFGLCSSFSFYYGHHISTIEGGMLCTDDFALYNLMLSIRSHGWSRDLSFLKKQQLQRDYDIDELSNFYTFYNSGFNLRSTDLNAFLGISQMKKIDKIVNKRESNYLYYKNKLNSYWSQNSNTTKVSSFAYGMLVDDRLSVYEKAKINGIEIRPLICGNLARHPFWKPYASNSSDLKNADIVHEKGIYLPNHLDIKESDIDYICDRLFNS